MGKPEAELGVSIPRAPNRVVLILLGVLVCVMVVGILVPTVMYALLLKKPTPTDLLVSVCICLFSCVIVLWILDATGFLPFRADWISKSIYGIAISSVLGTSVAVYRGAFGTSSPTAVPKHPFEGRWDLTMRVSWRNRMYLDMDVPVEHILLMTYSQDNDAYVGYSDCRGPTLTRHQLRGCPACGLRYYVSRPRIRRSESVAIPVSSMLG
jgi:hypothetical protein